MVLCLKFEPSSTLWSKRWSSYALPMFTVYKNEKICQIKTELFIEIINLNCMEITSPVVATWPVMPILMGNLDSNGLVRGLFSSSLTSFASKSKTLEKLPFDASWTNRIYWNVYSLISRDEYRNIERVKHCIFNYTWTRWHWIKLCIWVNIRSTMCSIVLCSSNIIRAKSKRTWFLFTSNWDFS